MITRKPMKFRGKEEWLTIDRIKSEEDDTIFYCIDTYHHVSKFNKDEFGRKTGLCNKCHLIVDFECKDTCIMKQISDIHER